MPQGETLRKVEPSVGCCPSNLIAARDTRCAVRAGMAGEAEYAAKATASVLIVVANCLVQAAAYSDCTKLPGPDEVLRPAL